ncbi:hypothetical protein Leryth_014213 [Lithospermum erythrorhizon]|uniref:LOB domain-containing protein n=1 Tax=Lithospermum erythrorhizon TaxID=34254 RepID=A0AAV3REI3_LITER|nr:hypothetical protein Leryth_014213 [Lithospermum erythrorhizon]
MTLKGGTSSACAACKYQRRRCVSDCPLAPYFPADQPKVFQNAHKLFGVSNILKILKQLDPSQQAEAMRSIKYQSNARDKNPTYGCLYEIQRLHMEIQMHQEELHAIHSQLAFFRQQQHIEISSLGGINDSMSQLQLGMAPPNNSLNMFHQDASLHYSNNNNISFIDPSKDNNFGNPMWIQPAYNSCNEINNSNSTIMQSQLVNCQNLNVEQQSVQDYDEIHPFFDTIDDRQSYIDSKEAYDSSPESSLRDTTQSIERVAENELKSAAACFSLTSVN